jgi:hypothetical protein
MTTNPNSASLNNMPCTCDLAAWYDLTREEVRPPCAKFETDHRFEPYCMGCEHLESCHNSSCEQSVTES